MKTKAKNGTRGIVWRDGGYWYNRATNGIGNWFNLEAKDPPTAVQRKLEILESSHLPQNDSWGSDSTCFIQWKLSRREYTPSNANKVKYILKDFASYFGDKETLSTLKGKHIQDWYESLLSRGLKASTAGSYIMAVRALFAWAIDVKKVCLRNPVKEIRNVIPTGIGKRNWLDKVSITDVLSVTSDNDKNLFFSMALMPVCEREDCRSMCKLVRS